MPTLVNFSLFVLQIKEKWFMQLLLKLFVLLIVPITWSWAHGHNLCLLPTIYDVGLPSKFVGLKPCLSDIRAFIFFSVPKLQFKKKKWNNYIDWLVSVAFRPMIEAMGYLWANGRSTELHRYPRFEIWLPGTCFHMSTLLSDNFPPVLTRRGNIEPLQGTLQYVCSGSGLAGI